MRGRLISRAIRDAAVTDYHDSGDTLSAVAARHGVNRTTLGNWIKQPDELGYFGGWEVRGGIQRPLIPSRRSA